MLFENCRSGEERHRCTFYLAGRQQKHLTVALKKRACNFAENIAREGQSTVIEADGKKLLKLMEEVGIVWDVSHLAEEAFWQGLDMFKGRIIASHSNCRGERYSKSLQPSPSSGAGCISLPWSCWW